MLDTRQKKNAHLRRDDLNGIKSCRAEATDVKIPITFPFHDPPAQEKRYKEERERREMRFGDRVGGQLLEKASGEMREDFSSPRTNPVPISRLYSLYLYMELCI